MYRLLQNELQRIQEVLDLRESDFRRQIEELNADNERQRKALSQVKLQWIVVFNLTFDII